jgi:hypothetical protein
MHANLCLRKQTRPYPLYPTPRRKMMSKARRKRLIYRTRCRSSSGAAHAHGLRISTSIPAMLRQAAGRRGGLLSLLSRAGLSNGEACGCSATQLTSLQVQHIRMQIHSFCVVHDRHMRSSMQIAWHEAADRSGKCSVQHALCNHPQEGCSSSSQLRTAVTYAGSADFKYKPAGRNHLFVPGEVFGLCCVECYCDPAQEACQQGTE